MLLFGAYCWRRNQRGFGDGHLPEDTLHETLVDAEGAPRHESARAPDALRLFLNGYTVVLAGLLVGVLWVAYDHSHDPAEEFERIEDAHVLNSFLDDLAETELEAREELPLTVPTGVFVQSVTFQSSKEVLINGFVWQRYTLGVHDGVTRGFLMPESSEADIEEIYRRIEGDTELIGWSFRVVVNQEFDYQRFPFGRENIWVQMWHSEFTENVVLVPDFDSYKTTRPSRLPGLRRDLEIPGWSIDETFFGYRYRTYDTSFGAQSFKDLTHFPELHFNILVRSEIVQPLVSHILPIAVMVALLYAILLLSSRYRAKADAFGFNAMNAIAAGSGFFLVAVFSHSDLRDTLSFRGINYLEYFYFLTYLVIMVVVLNALMLSLSRVKWIHTYDNGLPKLLFWPAFLTLAILATLRVFW